MDGPTMVHAVPLASRLEKPLNTSVLFLTAVHKFFLSLRPFRGIIRDVRARAPYYFSDWTDAWNYRVVPATALTFFCNIFPGIAFSLDLIETTQQYGITEVLVSSSMASGIFSLFGAQPLCIAGVTGPITVLNKTIFDVVANRPHGPDYLQFVGWVYLWGAILHWVTAALNWCNLLKYVTLFSCDTFGFFVSWVYLQYGVQTITRQLHSAPLASAFVTIILSLLMLSTACVFHIMSQSNLFHRHVRRFFADYGMPISIVASSAVAYWGKFKTSNPATLPVGSAFETARRRPWLVKFWELDAKWVGIAFPFGVALWVLFFFDHNVSSLMAQGSKFPLRKPPGFHYDFFLLGVTTLVAGLIGVPAPNGLIPQAPIHTQSLVVLGQKAKKDREKAEHSRDIMSNENGSYSTPAASIHSAKEEVAVAVVEQRVSNLAQGALCVVLLTGPFLHILGLIPRGSLQGVLAGLFWYMGLDALSVNGITARIMYLLRDHSLNSSDDPLHKVRKSRIVLFTLIELLAFGATMAIVQTIAAIGFPVIIMALVPLRVLLVARLPFTSEEVAILDGPTASPFTMDSVGGVA